MIYIGEGCNVHSIYSNVAFCIRQLHYSLYGCLKSPAASTFWSKEMVRIITVCKIPPQMNKSFILQGKVLLVIWAMKMKKKLPQSMEVGWKKVQEGVDIFMHIADSLCCNTRN